LDRDTLARIYTGDVSYWNDERIQALNPEVAGKLPARPIIISFAESNTTASASEVFKQALESFSLDFKRAFRAANRDLALMPPSLRGTAVALPPDIQTRINWIKVHTSSRTSLPLPHPAFRIINNKTLRFSFLQSHNYNIGVLSVGLARSNGLQYFDMINQAGNYVTPNASSVQSAMVLY
jgi:ABC-type phosphate transport system substrate-binding protein